MKTFNQQAFSSSKQWKIQRANEEKRKIKQKESIKEKTKKRAKQMKLFNKKTIYSANAVCLGVVALRSQLKHVVRIGTVSHM